jgi:hypothetical protein
VATDVGEEELEAVGGTGERSGRLEPRRLLLGRLLGVGGRGRFGDARGRADLDPDPLELGRQLLDLLLGQVQLDREGLELGGLEIPALLGRLDESARLVGLEQLVQLILGQGRFSPLGASSKASAVVLTLRGKSSPCHRHLRPWPSETRTCPRTWLFRRGRLLRLRADGEVELHLSVLI